MQGLVGLSHPPPTGELFESAPKAKGKAKAKATSGSRRTSGACIKYAKKFENLTPWKKIEAIGKATDWSSLYLDNASLNELDAIFFAIRCAERVEASGRPAPHWAYTAYRCH